MSILELLISLQWRHEKVGSPCPWCLGNIKYGHDTDCEISRRINQLKAAEKLSGENPEFDYKKLFDSLMQ